MIERLQFSIRSSITIAAPIDIVWDALIDLPSHPNIFAAVVKMEPIQDRSSGFRHSMSGGGSQAQSTNSSILSSQRDGTIKGTKWNITRRSTLENQRYSANATVTHYSEEEDRRSFTLSSHQVLGTTGSFKMIVERQPQPPQPQQEEAQQSPPTQNNDDKLTTTTTAQNKDNDAPEICEATIIMTMIPYQFFVKLLGIMCCLCLLKSRARVAIYRDLEDLADFCEKKVEGLQIIEEGESKQLNDGNENSNRRRRSSGREGEEGKSTSNKKESEMRRSSSSLTESESKNNNLQTVVEEDCSGC